MDVGEGIKPPVSTPTKLSDRLKDEATAPSSSAKEAPVCVPSCLMVFPYQTQNADFINIFDIVY